MSHAEAVLPSASTYPTSMMPDINTASTSALPDLNAPELILTQPTQQEQEQVWALNFEAWAGALSQKDYLEREHYLMTVPLAKNGGVTHWILVDKNAIPDQRRIFGSCETLLKPALITDRDGNVVDCIAHGVGSVFCDPQYRGRGYAGRMMVELGKKLRIHQVEETLCAFSVLWSDIGKTYYAKHGWVAFPSCHIEFPPLADSSSVATHLTSSDLASLCDLDEAKVRRTMSKAKDGKVQAAIVPNIDHMQWHHMREDFLCNKIFDKSPVTRGAIVGEPGHRVWAIWTRNFYGPVRPESGNVLSILRLVLEDEEPTHRFSDRTGGAIHIGGTLDKQAAKLKTVLQIAQAEAAEWKLNHVELWNPSPYVQSLLTRMNIKHGRVERDKESIASLYWYGEGSGSVDDLEWVGNEKYGWC